MEPRFEDATGESVPRARPERPRVSVVVPCRNERTHIEACLRSVLSQTLPPDEVEIIVVDGRSDDGTRAILDLLEAKVPNLTLLDNPGRITPVAMNLGIRAARGEFVAILGAHTIYPPGYLEVCLDLMQAHPEADCVGGSITHEAETPFGQAVALAMAHPFGMGKAPHRNPDHEGYAEGACFPVFRRAVFDRVGFYDEALVRNQDDEFNLRLTRHGGRVWLSPHARAAYHVRESLPALFRQFFEYGYWRTAVLRRHRFKSLPRRFVPAAGLAVFLITVVLAALNGGVWTALAAGLLLLYLVTLLGVGWTLAGVRALGFYWALIAGRVRGAAGREGKAS
jgi:succinoglycan biosynthesis protein ExoA